MAVGKLAQTTAARQELSVHSSMLCKAHTDIFLIRLQIGVEMNHSQIARFAYHIKIDTSRIALFLRQRYFLRYIIQQIFAFENRKNTTKSARKMIKNLFFALGVPVQVAS